MARATSGPNTTNASRSSCSSATVHPPGQVTPWPGAGWLLAGQVQFRSREKPRDLEVSAGFGESRTRETQSAGDQRFPANQMRRERSVLRLESMPPAGQPAYRARLSFRSTSPRRRRVPAGKRRQSINLRIPGCAAHRIRSMQPHHTDPYPGSSRCAAPGTTNPTLTGSDRSWMPPSRLDLCQRGP